MADSTITVGSSDVASILGISPWASPSQTWARLTGLVPRYESRGTDATRRGNMLEGALLDEWARRYSPLGRTRGPSIDEPPAIRDTWKSARVDMLAVMEDGPCIVEAKTTRSWDGWGDEEGGSPPLYYLAQVAWQMHVLDVHRADLIAFNALDDRVRVHHLDRDLEVEAQLVRSIEQWMEAHVWADPPVPPNDLPMDVVEVLYRDGGANKHWLDPDDEVKRLADELAAARAELASAEARESALKARLCERIGSAYGIRGVATWGQVKGRETVAIADLKAAYPDVYAKLAKRSGGHRQFRFIYKQESE